MNFYVCVSNGAPRSGSREDGDIEKSISAIVVLH